LADKYNRIMEIDIENVEYKMALDLIQETNQSFFFTGKAGTGKSTFLKYIVETVSKKFVVLAPTGIAAVNVSGVTIHSFFKFPLRPLIPEDEGIRVFSKVSDTRKIISELDTLIIDEISMVRVDLIDAIDISLRRNGGNPNLPFGGKQIVFVGDIFQLEPVTTKKSGDQLIIREIYGSSYFYNAKVFEKVNLLTIELQKVYRQTDPTFISLLDKVRIKEISKTEIDSINTRVFSHDELEKKEFAITLTSKNDLADIVNIKKLTTLTTKPFNYFAEVSGEFEENKYPTDSELILKEGAQVIFIKNDTEKRWVNGTIGQVSELSDTEIKVKLKNGTIHLVEKRVWENIRYHYNYKKRKIEQELVGTFQQFPLKLAWAITIHKSQGLTFDQVVIDFGSGAFASGQAYVALSRATTFEGIYLKQKFNSTDIFIDEEICKFAKSFNDKEKINESLSFGKKIFQYQKNNNQEQIGKLYLKDAIANLIIGNLKTAYSYLITGYEYVTCDCALIPLIRENQDEIHQILKSDSFSCTLTELDFIRAIFYRFADAAKLNKTENFIYLKALAFIDLFLDDNAESEIAHYFKGRILLGLEKYEEGISELEFALTLKETPRVHYMIGRLKEDTLEQFGVDHLYKSILLNPSSLCSSREFKAACDNRGIKLLTNSNKLLACEFNNKAFGAFRNTVSRIFLDGSVELADNKTLKLSEAIDDFLYGLRADEHLFGVGLSHTDQPDDQFVLINKSADPPINEFVKKSIPKKDELINHATMSLDQFKEHYADEKGVGVFINPNGNKHPKGYYLSWKDKEGVSHNGAVSNNINSVEEITEPVLSILSTTDSDELFLLMHNRAEAPANNQVLKYK